MPSERVQRQIDRLLDEAEQASAARDWTQVRDLCQHVLTFDPENEDGLALLAAANRGLAGSGQSGHDAPTAPLAGAGESPAPPGAKAASALPASFDNGRYVVKRFLGEGGKKKVYLAHDTMLDRDVAFALIKTEGLDATGRDRIKREAQAMGRLGSHPHIVSVLDFGTLPPLPPGEGGGEGAPFIVTELMGGGDVEGLIEQAPEHRLPLERSLEIGIAVCRGLELAHANGIVHRDLKPGNVWLTGEVVGRGSSVVGPTTPHDLRPTAAGGNGGGVAKIGDFGLAVALDRSRLTQAGMMVGTVSYMPPEQALGGAVTPKADLYSLGAMLYELVCGRPPFAGNESIAIITQHLSTPPVAPSWHNPQVPPALEALILHLLEKDPGKRPASATEVRQVLEAIDPSAPAPALSAGNPLQQVARGVFVGREQELARLRAAFDDAFAGHGGVVMLAGEPGIGKTRTAQELETYARIRGAQVLWGRTHEAAGAPAYWPWLQALRAYAAGTDPQTLRSQLGSAGPEVARIVSEIRERLPGLPDPPEIVDPETAQFRLFDAITTLLRNASHATPLLLVLDDLHWADRPTLLLLQHAAGEIGRSRILMLGTYRDVEVGRAHPLAETLAQLTRDGRFQRVLLRGLSRDEVEAYLRASANVDPAAQLLTAIYEETEGNPFFLSEVIALLTEQGAGLRGRAWGGGTPLLPQSVREVLGRRLDRLSRDCNELLTVAAIAGRDFRFDLLVALSDEGEDQVLALLEEALAARVIEEAGAAGEYRFSHALVQETLLGELSTTRRVRLHGRVAEALEALLGERVERHAAELAQHYGESATLTRSHAGRAVRFSRLAAEQAEASTAWDEAARHYGECLSLIGAAPDGLGEDEAALLVALGRCQVRSGAQFDAFDSRMSAVKLYRERQDGLGLVRATLALTTGTTLVSPSLQGELVKESLQALGSSEPYLRALLLEHLGRLSANDDEARRVRAEAAALAGKHDYADVEAFLLQQQGLEASIDLRLEEATRLLRGTHEPLHNAGRFYEAVQPLVQAGTLTLAGGDLERGERELGEALAYAAGFHLRGGSTNPALAALAGVALARGNFERSEQHTNQAGTQFGAYHLAIRARQAELRCDFERALRQLTNPERLTGAYGLPGGIVAVLSGCRARVLLKSGDDAGARRELERWSQALAAVAYQLDSIEARANHLVCADDALAALGDEARVQSVYAEVGRWTPIRFLPRISLGVDRFRGALALRLGLVDEAAAHFRTGLEWAERERCVIEHGRCLQGLAEVAELRGDHPEAARLLDRAAAIFQQYGIELYLRQVLAKKEILKA